MMAGYQLPFEALAFAPAPAPLDVHCGPPSDDYGDSFVSLELVRPGDRRVIAGRAYRTGVTAPGTPARAVYRIECGVPGSALHVVVPGLWVYEAGRLVALDDWRAANPPSWAEAVGRPKARGRKGAAR